MAAVNRDQARAIVERICKSKGGITQARREALSRSDPDILESIDSLREQLGTSVKVFAKNLYNTDVRFVFELIQNAEDNKYQLTSTEPFLTFKLYPTKIIVESNEDGFTEENVEAICAVGHSTKLQQTGYIGEKGIGFKSVFKVASNVHIQSGPFSFFFDHKEGDSGMGMLTPFYQAHAANVPPSVRTQMNLKLADTTQSGRIIGGFSELPDSLLMFLTKIRKLTVINFDENSLLSKVMYSYETTGQRGTLTKYIEMTGTPGLEIIRHYHITKKTLYNLPKDTSRPKTSQVEVVLAFPLDPECVPIIEQQHVFAYLPVRQFGFSFLIQSDFITPPNREDIPDSLWNQTIRSGIAETFRDAVLRFCQHPTLQFQWMRYLPSGNVPGSFWGHLLHMILHLLKQTPILRPWSGGPLKQPHQLKWQSSDSVDQYGDPLFNDLSEELYLSKSYNWTDSHALNQLEVRSISMSEVLARVRADLSSPSSKMKSATMDQDWHSRSAKLLMIPLKKNWSEASQVMDMNLIPLQGGSWVSGYSGSIYDPYDDTIPIPTDLGLRLVDPNVLENDDRKMLMSMLGVKVCQSHAVIARILARYTTGTCYATLQLSIMHLRYLYWRLPRENPKLHPFIYIMDNDLIPIYRDLIVSSGNPIIDDLYFESDDEFGPKQLFAKVTDGYRVLAPGHPAHFIHRDYLNVVSASARHNNMSWEDWLETVALVHRVPRLTRMGSADVSMGLRYIIEYRCDKVVGMLKEHWNSYWDAMTAEVYNALRETCVACEDVTNTPLEKTYMPLPKLKQICRDFGVAGRLPFLSLPTEIGDEPGKEWDFLNDFRVGRRADVHFYLNVLRIIVKENVVASKLSEVSKKNLFEVYKEIEKHSKADDQDDLIGFFSDNKAIYAPARGQRSAMWADPSECVWEAPDFFDLSFSLASAEEYRDNKALYHLFNGILGIFPAGYYQYVQQLKAEKNKPAVAMNPISDIYHHIQKNASHDEAWDFIREEIHSHNLVYVPSHKMWCSPSSCLWTDNTRISGKFAIAFTYTNLQTFFVGRLGVQRPELHMYVDELTSLANNGKAPLTSQVRDLIWDINSLGPTQDALTGLRQCNVLPVRGMDGQTSLRNNTDIFAIVDRLQYGELFKAKIPVLDFDLEEIHKLRFFLSALNLGSRYMTRIIMEVTTANDSSIDLTLSRRMQEKAYAVFRCAIHYGVATTQDQLLYRRLLAVDVFRSSSITRSMTISLCGSQTTVEGASANLHMEDDVSQFRLYVPQNEVDREICYLHQIPETFVSHLKIGNPSAAKVIGDLVKATHAVVLERLLQEHGIVTVPGVEPLPVAPSEAISMAVTPQPRINYPNESLITPSGCRTSPSSYQRSPSPNITSSRVSSNYEHSPTPTTFPFGRGHSTPASSISPSPLRLGEELIPEQPIFRSAYLDLLQQVITAARHTNLPRFSARPSVPILDTEPNTLSDDVFGRRSDGQMSHDTSIGAAGELYVFEMLLKLNLTNFGRDNWKSTIRNRVCGHEKYRDMEPWKGAETADIVYEDSGPDFQFTKILESLGYLCAGDSPVKYYIEVKTTKNECGTRLFLSRAQYRRMKKMTLREDRPAPEIYIIMRVFNLGKANMGMRLYVDPATMEENGQLIFEPESYTMVPAINTAPTLPRAPVEDSDEEL